MAAATGGGGVCLEEEGKGETLIFFFFLLAKAIKRILFSKAADIMLISAIYVEPFLFLF